jgi:Flp pilus assembly protein TadD
MDEDAKKFIEQALELNHDERHEEAEEVLRKGIESHPENLELKVELGITLAAMARDEPAERVLRRVLDSDPTHQRAAGALGRLLDSCLRSDEAESLYRDMLELKPRSHQIAEDLVRLLVSEDRTVEALRLARAQADTYPQNYGAYDALTFALMKVEDDLEGLLAEDLKQPDNLLKVISNLLEQYSVYVRMLDQIDEEVLGRENRREILEDEIDRVLAELASLEKHIEKNRSVLPPGVLTAVDDLVSKRSGIE